MGPEEAGPGTFTVYCDGVPLQEIREIRLPELSPEDAQELEAASTSFCGEIQLVCDFDKNAFVAGLPVVYRVLMALRRKGLEAVYTWFAGLYEAVTAWVLQDTVKGVETAAGPQERRVKGTLKTE